MISIPVRSVLRARLGRDVTSARPVSGGSISSSYACVLSDGGPIFVKASSSADAELFRCEARGLAWLAEAGAVRVPRVLAVCEPGEPGFIALELIEPGPRRRDFDAVLGRGLARLHGSGADRFGLDHDNYIGSLPQANAPLPSWAEFYGERRLLPQIEAACRAGRADPSDARIVEHLCARLPALVGPEEPPSRLHGDLWSGNLLVDESGAPVLIDPAVCGGHRELDLAMMSLFGGFSERVFASYDEARPLDPDWRERTDLYQLYFLLVHVNLFGRSYLAQARNAMNAYR